MRRVLGVAVALGGLVGGCYAAPATDEDVAVTQQEVQSNYLTIRTKRYIEAVTGNAVNATASVHVKWPNLNPPSGSGAATCGATFVSPHFAITAAHCVDRKGPGTNDPVIGPNDTIELRQYDTRNLDWFRALESGVVSGDWPSWSRGTTLTPDDGYIVTSFTNCTVKVRCGLAPTSNCPSGATDGDVALIRCPSRASSAPFSTVSTTEAVVGQQIEILWFHELLGLPSEADPGNQYWDHYGNKTSEAQNWHYRTLHQLLPFRSTSWDNSTPYKVVAAASDGETWTDAFGCHGTSGSGVFKAGTTKLLGPIIHPGHAFFTDGNLLCADMDDATVAPGDRVLSYTRQSMTRAIEQINIPAEGGLIVVNDRPH